MNNKNPRHAALLSLCLMFSAFSYADEPPLSRAPAWGVGMSYRSAQIPFDLQTHHVSTMVPLFYYQGEYFFLDGASGGLHLWQSEPAAIHNAFSFRPMSDWQLDLHSQLRFTNIPKSKQNQQQADAADVGLRLRHQFNDSNWGAFGGYTDSDGRWYADATWGQSWLLDSWLLEPTLRALQGSELQHPLLRQCGRQRRAVGRWHRTLCRP